MARSSTTYPRKWKSGKTTVIRVPELIADELLEIAQQLDDQRSLRVRSEPSRLILEATPSEDAIYSSSEPVNVASVPQRSPFRYPGGKTWLIPYIRAWLRSRRSRPSRLIEPFAGGAIVSLTVAFEALAKHVVFAELDEGVAAVWRVILNGHAEWLADQIVNFDLTLENARRVLAKRSDELKEKAFQTILRNRVQRGGIMALGAGLIKAGENGRGIKSRWYRETLARRIREINLLKDRLSFIEGDGLALIAEHEADADAVFYVDPPYTVAARRLYSKWEIDHVKLFSAMQSCKGDFLMSYDNTVEISELAKRCSFDTRAIAMKNTHHAKMTELLIGKDLSWLAAEQ